jgi:hypothetical protein
LIDLSLMPTLTVFQLYRGVKISVKTFVDAYIYICNIDMCAVAEVTYCDIKNINAQYNVVN